MSEEDRGNASPLGEAALAFFDRGDLRELATAALQGRISRGGIAGFARVVHDAARLGDAGASAIVDRAASALAALAADAIARLRLGERQVRVAFSGGAFRSEAFFARARERLALAAPNATAVTPRYDPAIGAALLAFGDAELPVPNGSSKGDLRRAPACDEIVARLRGGLIVSVQAEPGSPLNAPEAIALIGRAAVANGAAGVRAEGLARLGAMRAR